MKALRHILFLLFTGLGFLSEAQPDFFTLYRNVIDLNRRVELAFPVRQDLLPTDTAEIAALEKNRNKRYRDSVGPLLKQVTGLSFPDINYTDMNGKSWSLSDFTGHDLIVNYTYLYCAGCVHRVDSTLKRTRGKNVKMIVLVPDIYKKDVEELYPYSAEAPIGLINYETRDLVSLMQGDDCMYYLDSNRRIAYFDKTEASGRHGHHAKWLAFLDEYLK